jgi:hypothetical protein
LNKPPFAVWQQPVQVAVVIDDVRQRPRWQLTAQLALRLAPRVPESSKSGPTIAVLRRHDRHGEKASLSADLRRACRSAILASGSNNMKGGDPVSHCLIVATFAVAWISDARVAV